MVKNMGEDRHLMNFSLDKRTKNISKISFLAIILIIIGIMVSVGIRGFGPREDENRMSELRDWAKKTMYVGALIYYVGVGILSICFLSMAFFAKRMHLYMRIGLIIATALLLGPTLNASYYLIGF